MLFWLIPSSDDRTVLLAGEAMWQSIKARISLREIDDETTGGKLSLRSQPGMDRILEGLTDVRRHNILNSLLALTSVFLLGLATVIANQPSCGTFRPHFHDVWVCPLFHSFFTSDAVRQQGDHALFGPSPQPITRRSWVPFSAN